MKLPFLRPTRCDGKHRSAYESQRELLRSAPQWDGP